MLSSNNQFVVHFSHPRRFQQDFTFFYIIVFIIFAVQFIVEINILSRKVFDFGAALAECFQFNLTLPLAHKAVIRCRCMVAHPCSLVS